MRGCEQAIMQSILTSLTCQGGTLKDRNAAANSAPRCFFWHSQRYLMTTKLEGDLKRELLIGREAYTLTLTPMGFALTLKGRRKGLDIKWVDLVTGEAALAAALNASLTANIQPPDRTDVAKSKPTKAREG